MAGGGGNTHCIIQLIACALGDAIHTASLLSGSQPSSLLDNSQPLVPVLMADSGAGRIYINGRPARPTSTINVF
jgi:hypothetical protein